MKNMSVVWIVLICFLTNLSVAFATVQTPLPQGDFFEAEDYDHLTGGDAGFAVKTPCATASGSKILTGMSKDGLIRYDLNIVKTATYTLWARCAATSDASLRFGFGSDTARLSAARVAKTHEKIDAPQAYQWRLLGNAELSAGKTNLFIGRGGVRYDSFFLCLQTDFTVTDDLLARVERAKESPKGTLLPELVHTRSVTNHPRWLMTNALRPAYGHFEWDKKNSPQSWAKMAREAGANCLFGVGEMPAGTLNGKMKAYSFETVGKLPFEYPTDYKMNDHSWVKGIVDAGHAEGLKVVMYDGAFRTLDPILAEHPEWQQQDSNNKLYEHGFGSWYSPYRAAYIKRWVKVAQECGIDGIMVDMLFTCPRGGDYSPYTVRAFKEKFGVEPPQKEDYRDLTWQRWIDFQTWTREEVMLDLTEALHAVNPEIAVIFNQVSGWLFTRPTSAMLSSRAGSCADGLLEEMGWEISSGSFADRPFAWPLQSAWQSLFLNNRTAYGQMWHVDDGVYTRVNHEALSYSMFANGIAPAVVVGGNWDHMQQVWRHIKPCENYMTGAKLVPYVALHFSENTLNWYANAQGKEATSAYLKNVFGFFQALLETHLPVAIITDDDLEDVNNLKPYATVILPNTACLADKQAAALADYVQGGGGLIASFETGVYDENGTRRETPALKDLLGAKQGQAKGGVDWAIDTTNQTHTIVNIPEITNGGDPSQGQRDRLPKVTFFVNSPTRNALVLKTTALPGGEAIRLNGAGSGYSTLHARTVGAGRVAYFPPDIGYGYFSYNHPIAQRLIERTVHWSASVLPLMETDAPMAVQTVCFRKGNELIVHLVNDNSSFGRSAAPTPENFGAFRNEILPIYNIKVVAKGDYCRAILLPEGKELSVKKGVGAAEVIVPRLDIHVMVVFF